MSPVANLAKSPNRKPKVISILNEKGGVGKSTIAMNLAGYLHSQGFKVIILDTDAQGSICDWARIDAEYRPTEQPQPIRVERVREPVIDKLVEKLQEYDFIIIDGGKGDTRMVHSASNASDLILIPMKPSPVDLWASDIVAEIAAERIQLSGGRIRARIVVSQAYFHIPPMKITTASREKMEQSYPDLPIMDTTIHIRQGYLEVLTLGTTVTEWAAGKNDRDSVVAAAREIESLGKEVLGLLK